MNLIPQKAGTTPSYYCTWEAQNNVKKRTNDPNPAKFEGDQGAQLARASLNDELLFGENGLALQYDKIRGDLYFVLDDGWDVPYGVNPATQKQDFGSLLLNEERFPSCDGTPAERLAKMNDRMKALGWKGVGLWVASQAQGEMGDNRLSKKQSIEYWTQRLKWCHQANIGYWKVDWGLHCHCLEFRQMLTNLAKQICPGLIIEHCRCMKPVNENAGRFDNWGEVTDNALKTFRFSDAFRSYDVTIPLSAATTLDRLAVLLQAPVDNGALGIINGEDELYVGAALGCAIGVMRSKLDRGEKRLDEATRAARWQRFAPAFGAGICKTNISMEIGTDTWHFKPGDTWASELIGTTVSQCAPMVIARGLDLPHFYDTSGDTPYVIAARNPSGATSIATIRRTFADGIRTPGCKIQLNAGASGNPIGIFGYYKELTINFDDTISAKKIYAQDLAGEAAQDITSLVMVDNNRLVISGKLITKIGLENATSGDLSEPGLVLVIKGDE